MRRVRVTIFALEMQ